MGISQLFAWLLHSQSTWLRKSCGAKFVFDIHETGEDQG
jgi:hypothetical protein